MEIFTILMSENKSDAILIDSNENEMNIFIIQMKILQILVNFWVALMRIFIILGNCDEIYFFTETKKNTNQNRQIWKYLTFLIFQVNFAAREPPVFKINYFCF